MPAYTAPPYGSSGSTIHSWLLEALADGESWLKTQQPSQDWDSILKLLSGDASSVSLPGQSNTGYNKCLRIAKELVASLSNFRHEGEFKVDRDKSLYDQAQLLTKRDHAWYRSTHAYARFREVMQYAVALGTGYLMQDWEKGLGGKQGDVRLVPIPPDSVYCIQLPADHDLQKAYAVIIRMEMPINLARRIYSSSNPAFAAQLSPDHDAPSWLEKGLRKVQDLIGNSPVSGFFKGSGLDKRNAGSYPTVDIYHAYIWDGSLNESGQAITMGTLGTNWSYEVPSLGSLIPTGISDENGQPRMREATPDDCRMFPLRRLCIFSRTVEFPAYDGSSPWWHGKVPLARFRFNDWPWEALGSSLLTGIGTMQAGIESIMRDIEDTSHARLDPPLIYDDTRVDKAWAEAVNPRRAGVRAAADLNVGEIFKVLGQQWQYEVPTWIPDWIKQQESRMEAMAGTPDLIAIAKAKQVPGASTLEKLMEMAGPLVQDMIRNVEEPLYELGEMRKALFLQFDSRMRWLQVPDPARENPEEIEYDPALILPIRDGESAQAHRDRQRVSMDEFHFHLTQSGVNEIYRLTNKLAYLQLAKAGLPIDWWTLARIWQVPNFGAEPEGTHTVMERFVAQKHLERELAEELSAGQAQAGGGAGGKGGRPQTGAREPRLVQKDGGTRSTVTTAKS